MCMDGINVTLSSFGKTQMDIDDIMNGKTRQKKSPLFSNKSDCNLYLNLKVHYAVLGRKCWSGEKDLHLFYDWINKINRLSLFSWLNKPNKSTDLKGQQHNFILLHWYLADPDTFLASSSVLWTLFSSESCLFFPDIEKTNARVCIITSLMR